jgi:hypothetical protein
MKDLQKAKELADKLRAVLTGQLPPSYPGKIIMDVFVVPDMLILAKLVYRERLNYCGFPFLPADNLTMMLAFDDHTLKSVKEVVSQDYKSLPLGEQILELIHNLPDMTDPTKELERDQQQSQ